MANAVPVIAAETVGDVVESLQMTLDAISTYQCELHVTSILESQQEERVIAYAFKRPKLIRMRILSGPDQGSVLVYNGGKVRGRRGGLLSWIALTYPPSHSEVTTIRGGRVDQSDFLFIQEVLRNALPQGALCLMGSELLHGREHDRLELDQHVDPLESGAFSGRFWVDHKNFVVTQYELYDDAGRLIYRQTHEGLALNVPLSEEVFKP